MGGIEANGGAGGELQVRGGEGENAPERSFRRGNPGFWTMRIQDLGKTRKFLVVLRFYFSVCRGGNF
jgi:hypothetical protein